MNLTKTLLAVALGTASVASFAQADPAAMQNKPMPAFSMKDLKGKAITNASLKGKVVIFDFWATWCGPCKAASPIMQELHKKYASKGLVVVGANVSDKPGAAAAYSKEHGYTYTFATGGEPTLEKFGFQGIPAFVFMDKKGIIRKVQVGFGTSLATEFENTVKKLLAS